jgi:hypothetical protein
MSSGLRQVTIPLYWMKRGSKISLTVGIGEEVHYEGAYCKDEVKVNLAGKWERGFKEPLWVIGSLKPSELLRVYSLRAKIDLNSCLNISFFLLTFKGGCVKFGLRDSGQNYLFLVNIGYLQIRP